MAQTSHLQSFTPKMVNTAVISSRYENWDDLAHFQALSQNDKE